MFFFEETVIAIDLNADTLKTNVVQYLPGGEVLTLHSGDFQECIRYYADFQDSNDNVIGLSDFIEKYNKMPDGKPTSGESVHDLGEVTEKEIKNNSILRMISHKGESQ